MTRARRGGVTRAAAAAALAVALAAALGACGEEKLSVEELQDPSTCMGCHPKHHEQWSGSMHAYAADDPVFLAMNKRGQRETNGKLGDFCINCHAPMAKQLGFTDFANFDPAQLPPAARGITCYFCHNVARVTSTHDNGLVLANDQTMRGGVKDPVETTAHHSKYDPLMDSARNKSEMCGSCHDIVVPASINGTRDVAVERTFAEWQGTFFASSDNPGLFLSCGGCHMESSRLEPIADAPGVRPRPFGFHDHTLPGIDLALTPFPQMEAQRAGVKDILDPSIKIVGPVGTSMTETGGICLAPDGVLSVRTDSIGVGQSWPSGAAQDRRAWLEVIGYDGSGNVLLQSGVVPPGVDPERAPQPGAPCRFDGEAAPQEVCGFWDKTFKAGGQEAHFFWEIDRYESRLLLAPPVPGADVSRKAVFNLPQLGVNPGLVERVTARFRFNPLPYAMLDDLIASGDLAPGIRDEVKTLEVGKPTVWLRAKTNPATRCNDPAFAN